MWVGGRGHLSLDMGMGKQKKLISKNKKIESLTKQYTEKASCDCCLILFVKFLRADQIPSLNSEITYTTL